MSAAISTRTGAVAVLADGSIRDGMTRIMPWPSLRMTPVRTLQLTQEILWAQPGDRLWDFSRSIPPSILALVRTAPANPWDLLELVAAVPDQGGALIRQCPALALLVARSCPVDLPDRAAFYRRVLEGNWRRIMAAIGLPSAPRYVRLVRKLALPHCHEGAIDELRAAITGRHPHLRILGHFPRITRDTVALLALPPKLINSHLLRASLDSPADAKLIYWRIEAVSWLREIDDPGCQWPYGRLRAEALARVESRMRERVSGDAEYLAPFPPPPFPGVSGFIAPLRNYWAIVAEGHEQHNCSSHYVQRIFEGSCYLYAVTGAERATLLLRRVVDSDRWIIGDLRADGNRMVRPVTRQRIEAWLRDSQYPNDRDN